MSAAPDPAEIAAPSDPALYARKPLLGPMFWVMIVLCVACVGAGVAIARFGPTWFMKKGGAPEAPPPTQQPVAAGFAAPLADTPAVAAPPAPPPSAEVDRLEARIALLESGQRRTLDAAAGALAAASLAEAAQSGEPFADAVAALERVLPPSSEVRALERLARQGAPTVAGLAASFDDLAGRASVAAHEPGPDAGALAKLQHALSRVVTIRQVGSTAGNGPDAVLARAEVRLDAGDLTGALRALDALPPGARPVLAAWRAEAERRAEIDRLVAAVRDEALAGLMQVSRAQADARLAGVAPVAIP
ncbi:COG4223 family protein [Caulobacter endophyticus]|uniref:Inner membrane protein n=1 Tax=Caulobacter endophyticus TaxID=2172652 RepID=A0A2T9JL45_9CAUL|nr:hypothetical protein [Caulobacter endophyticus]PVM84398.1 hypothetical protein DDF67_19640 [Caulobacter endophyticus]